MIREGSVIGDYQVQARIGQGASAIVHRGVHTGLGRQVALKFLPLLHQDVERARFLREAKALRRMNHPNVVQVLDTGEAEGMPFMVFDYVPGGSLADHMADGPIPLGDALRLLDGIAKGLDYAHGCGIIHRDVKPANVLLDTAGVPVIADFGLARLLEQPSATATGMFAGTPAYMSPEQAEGQAITPASDQYSLAAMAYELLTGQVPFPGDTVSEVLTALLTRPPAAPSTVRTGLSPKIDATLLRGLSKRPEQRWPSCQALVDALLAAIISTLSSEPVALPAISSSPVAPSHGLRPGTLDPQARIAALKLEPSEPYLTLVVPYTNVRRPRRLRRRLATLVATALLLGSVTVGALWMGGVSDVLAWSHPTSAPAAASVNR
ncbi:MAG TPA: serine/threonine-protein kinase [Candidatus Dormibacteraeota bacterium]|nr:serine/threonine-protein kinase [Candidatus Dormibacteraeota bacterium]